MSHADAGILFLATLIIASTLVLASGIDKILNKLDEIIAWINEDNDHE